MGKNSLKVRGVNAGQAAKVLVQQGYAKDEKTVKRQIRTETKKENHDFKKSNCYVLQLPTIASANSFHELVCMDIHKMMVAMTEKSKDYARILEALMLQDDEIPLAFYCDECTPGNPLQPDPSRKISMLYVAPLSKEACRNEDTWFTFTGIRQQCLRQIPGGLNSVLHAILKDLADKKVPQLLKAGQSKRLVTYSVAFMISDESALHGMLGCKGSAGRKPCYRCANLVSKLCRRQLADQMGDKFYSLEHATLNDVVRSSDTDIWQALEVLAEKKTQMSKGTFAELEKNMGWNHVSNSFLLDHALRNMLPPNRFLFDPLHVYYSQGILGIEVKLLLDHFTSSERKLLVDTVHRVARSFSSRKKPNLLALECKYFSEEQWKANASTQLGLWPLLHFALETEMPKETLENLGASLQSFRLLCEDLKFVLLLKHANLECVLETWRGIQSRHMQAFVLAYGPDALRPKHHFRLHLAEDYIKNHYMYDCNTMERKHRLCKAEINARGDNLKPVDDYITPRLCLLQLEQMASYKFAKKILPDDALQWGSMEIKSGTPLLFPQISKLILPQRWEHRLDGIHAIGCTFETSRQISANITCWNFADTLADISLETHWLIPMYWCQQGNQFLTIL